MSLVGPKPPRGRHHHHVVEQRLNEDSPGGVPPEALPLVNQRAEKPLHVQADREGNYEK